MEKKAIEEARNELLKPEAVNNVALQSSTDQTSLLKSIPEDVNQKMAEIIDDNNQIAGGSSKTEKRASISSQLTQTQTDDIMSTPIGPIDKVLEKVEKDDEQDNKVSQKELNKKTMLSLQGGSEEEGSDSNKTQALPDSKN